MIKRSVHHLVRTFLNLVLLLGLATPAWASTQGPAPAPAGGSVVIVSLNGPAGQGHAVTATKIEVNDTKTEVTITIRDPECPNKTSKLKVEVASQKVTAHEGEPCHNYTGWKVAGVTRIRTRT